MSTQSCNYDQSRETDAVERSCIFCCEPIKGEMFKGEFVGEDAREDGEGWIHEKCVLPEIVSTLTSEQRFEMQRFVEAARIVLNTSEYTLELFDRHPLANFELRDLKDEVEVQLMLLNPDPSPFPEELVLVRHSALVKGKAAILGEIGKVKNEIFMLSPAAPLSLAVKTDRLEFLKKAANGLQEANYE